MVRKFGNRERLRSLYFRLDHSDQVADNKIKKEASRSDFLKQNALALSSLEAYQAQTGTSFDILQSIILRDG